MSRLICWVLEDGNLRISEDGKDAIDGASGEVLSTWDYAKFAIRLNYDDADDIIEKVERQTTGSH